MSGGVDSSVGAILLKEQGYDIIGVTMNLLPIESEDNLAIMDAKNICDKLSIPHYTIDFTKEFNNCVINNFKDEYKNCRTPNPCIECNKHLKFNAMYKKALEFNADYIATGHYAKIEYSDKYKRYILRKASNINKDQSYVLYNIPKELLSHVLFPLSNFNSKEEIRSIARKYDLSISNKPDSEDICFIPDGNYKKYLEENSDIKSKEGNIIYKGDIIGKHTGLYKYTIGQRKGLGISHQTPLYVIGFNKDKNELIVGDEKDLYVKSFKVKDYNLLLIDEIKEPLKVLVKTRYKSKESEATISMDKNFINVCFSTPQKGVTPGQSAVFYIDDIVLGGGIIV